MKAPDAPRRAAWETLLAVRRGRVSLEGPALEGLSGSERRRAYDLVQGVRRHLFLLDAVLRRFLRGPVRSVPPPVREALRLGVYEILYRPQARPALVVAETVSLAGRSAALRGLTNAVLRRIVAEVEFLELPDAEWPADRRTVWVGPGRVARFERPVLPDPAQGLARHRALHFSLTEEAAAWLIAALPEEHDALFRALDTPLPVALRPTWRSGGMEALCARLRSQGVALGSVRGAVIEVHPEISVGRLDVIREGLAVVQDRTAAEVAPFLGPRPGERILDVCAAPGGKTLHLAELMEDTGVLVATDRPGPRLERLRENVDRLGLGCVRILPTGDPSLAGELFDRVLLDVPCSNSGVLMKRVDARYRLTAQEIARLGAVQRALLEHGAAALRPGGTLCYSTCSILDQENRALLGEFLADHPEFRLAGERLLHPHETQRDGGYMALLVK